MYISTVSNLYVKKYIIIKESMKTYDVDENTVRNKKRWKGKIRTSDLTYVEKKVKINKKIIQWFAFTFFTVFQCVENF